MPFVSIKMLEGRTKEQKKNLIKSVTESVSKSLGISEENVWTVIEEFPPDEWGFGGKTACEKIKKNKKNGGE